MHGAQKRKRLTLPNYAPQMGGREPRLLGKCEAELAEWSVLSASWIVSEMAVEVCGVESCSYLYLLQFIVLFIVLNLDF